MDPITLANSIENLTLKGNTSTIKVRKIDVDTNEPIPNTVFQLSREDGSVIGTATTNAEGIVIFTELYQGTYNLQEIKNNDSYEISNEITKVITEYNKTTEIQVTNEKKKGQVRVIKVDKDNNKIGLGDIKFDLYSEEFKKVIGTYTTDVNGEIFIENLRIGNYKLIEKITNKWYNLNDEAVEIKINWGKITDILVENELKKGQVKVIKKDSDNNEISLGGVKFDVLDEKGTVLETIITNEKGEAYTSEYPVRDYEKLIIREIETLDEYVLQKNPQIVELKANEIIEVEFTNELKKGQIRIIKVDKDNNEIKLSGVKFNIYDENNNLVQTLVTDENR